MKRVPYCAVTTLFSSTEDDALSLVDRLMLPPCASWTQPTMMHRTRRVCLRVCCTNVLSISSFLPTQRRLSAGRNRMNHRMGDIIMIRCLLQSSEQGWSLTRVKLVLPSSTG